MEHIWTAGLFLSPLQQTQPHNLEMQVRWPAPVHRRAAGHVEEAAHVVIVVVDALCSHHRIFVHGCQARLDAKPILQLARLQALARRQRHGAAFTIEVMAY